MKRMIVMAMSLVAATMLVVSPVAAKKHGAKHTGPTCKQIKEAMAGGKSADDVQKDMHVTAGRVKDCTAAPKHRAKKSAKKT